MNVTKLFPDTMALSHYIYPRAAGGLWSVDWFEGVVRSLGFDHFKWIENTLTDTQACMCTKGDSVFIAVRGSSSDEDWETNFDIKQMKCKWGKFHQGFMKDAESIYYYVVDNLLRSWYREKKHLIITGHSQGAGVGNGLGVKLLEHNRDLFKVITYGGPRTADDELADYLDTNYADVFHRVVNNNDIVTRVPPEAFGYKHFGKFHYFYGDGSYSDNVNEWQYFKDRVVNKFDFGGEWVVDILDDHDNFNYLDLCNQFA